MEEKSRDEALVFTSSPNSRGARLTRQIPFWAVFWTAVMIYVQWDRSTPVRLGVSLLFDIVLFGGGYWFLRRLTRPGLPVITLDAQGITARDFDLKWQTWPWSDVVGATLQNVKGSPVLEVQLKETEGRVDRKSFVEGRNPCRKSVGLALLEPAQPARVLAAIQARLAPAS